MHALIIEDRPLIQAMIEDCLMLLIRQGRRATRQHIAIPT